MEFLGVNNDEHGRAFATVEVSVARYTEYFRIFGKNGQVFGIRIN